MEMKKLSNSEIQEQLNEVEKWERSENQIKKSYSLKDFQAIMNFVNKVAEEAEKMNHHPDIFIHSWNKVEFTLSTHSEGGLTKNDFELAKKIDSINKDLT
jgi:4a-hydroxytetrahydrobiopterin dehydratase